MTRADITKPAPIKGQFEPPRGKYRLWFLEHSSGVPGYWTRLKPLHVHFESESSGIDALNLAKTARPDTVWRLIVIEAHGSWRTNARTPAVMMTVAGKEVAR